MACHQFQVMARARFAFSPLSDAGESVVFGEVFGEVASGRSRTLATASNTTRVAARIALQYSCAIDVRPKGPCDAAVVRRDQSWPPR